ncbi:MAG: dTDP-glucose 4,6-dehydratase [Leptospirillia bacterium]
MPRRKTIALSEQVILVTGGAGFIGSNFVRHTLAVDPEVRIINLDLLTYAGRPENLEDLPDPMRHLFVRGDIRDVTLVNQLMSGSHPVTHQAGFAPPTRVVHFAAESHVDRSITGPETFVTTNVQGTFVLLEAARAAWGERDDTRFLHVSTDEVYGSLGPTGYFTEETPLAPNSPYSASKASSDLLARSWFHTYGFPVVTTRCSNNYGPYQLPEKFIPVVIESVLAKKPIPVYGDGKNVRDWLYVIDHVEAILRVLEAGQVGEVYNIGGHNEWANTDIAGILCDLVDAKTGSTGSRELISFVTDRPGHDRRYAIDAGRMERELGWLPSHTFETGIDGTVDWYLKHRDWVQKAQEGM